MIEERIQKCKNPLARENSQIWIEAYRKYKEMGIADLYDLLFEEQQNPKFLGHVLFTEGWEILEELPKGEAIFYENDGFYNMFTFSLHGPGGTIFYCDENSSWYGLFPNRFNGVRKSYGIVLFNERFHDKICSPEISNEELEKIRLELELLHREKLDKWKNENYTFNLNNLEKMIKTITGIPLREFVNDMPVDYRPIIGIPNPSATLETIKHCIDSILTLRRGDFYYGYNDYDINSGIMAVQLTKERDLVSLPIIPEDVKYLISINHDTLPVKYNILMGNK